MAKAKVIGTWDDYDFGRNDAGKEFPFKKQTQQLALDFLNVAANSPLREIEGLYSSNTYQIGSKGAILLSGDRHIGEVSKIDLGGLNFPLFDITSSGLTHSAINNTKEPNALRGGSLVNQKNFGLIRFKECNQQIEIELKGVENKRFNIEKLVF